VRYRARVNKYDRSIRSGPGDLQITVRAVVMAFALSLVAIFSLFTTGACSTDFAVGVAFPRGFFDYGFNACVEHNISYGPLPPYLHPTARGSGYFAFKDNVRHAVGSASLLLKLSPPRPVSGTLGFSPYVSAGPSLNYVYSWADLEDFGTMSASETSTTFTVFAGAEFLSTAPFALFVEARQTVPSDFTFDYVLVGLKLRGSPLPSIF
jgi:hypothetical protein